MLAFMAGVVSVWVRGYSIECGCFGSGGDSPDGRRRRLGRCSRTGSTGAPLGSGTGDGDCSAVVADGSTGGAAGSDGSTGGAAGSRGAVGGEPGGPAARSEPRGGTIGGRGWTPNCTVASGPRTWGVEGGRARGSSAMAADPTAPARRGTGSPRGGRDARSAPTIDVQVDDHPHGAPPPERHRCPPTFRSTTTPTVRHRLNVTAAAGLRRSGRRPPPRCTTACTSPRPPASRGCVARWPDQVRA